MDRRTPLQLHTVLAFEGMACHVEEVIGRGSNAIVYKGWYPDRLNPDRRHYVLIKELYPSHPEEKIWRNADNRIIVEAEAQDHWETHRKSFQAGNEIHLRLLADHPDMVGGNLNSFPANGTLYSILGYTGGRSLQAELNHTGHDLRHYARLMQRLLDALEAFHKSGYLHLDISPDNIMLVGKGENERIFLIDFNSAYELGSGEHAYLSWKPGYSAPEVELGDQVQIGFSSDLYGVAAVFYRSLMGRTLTLEETLQAKGPEGKESVYLKDMPETVVSMVGRILKKGLNTLSGKRYQSIGKMRQAFSELIDRIDCVGVTHWALWENGKRSVEELIRINPSLRYVKEANKLYPIRLGDRDLSRYLEDALSPEGKSSLIVAQGGMGKTTLLLHTAMLQGKRYSPSTSAVFYISLNGWDGKDSHYIQNQILKTLRFKREMNNYDSARHALQQLLNQPLKTKAGYTPTVLLLLDGLNEIHDEGAVLVREINELSKLSGVRIIATSRKEMEGLELETIGLAPLEVEDIETALGRNGLLIPQTQDVIQLLRTPLILSIYIRASEAGKQLDIATEEELMKAYMDSLLQKELKQLPEDSPEKWQIDVALNYILPAIAAEVKKRGRALTEPQMLKVVESCRKVFRSPLLKRVFPQWIGHSKDIFREAKTAEQWYGIVIHSILYQRLGLLSRDNDGSCRVFHQAVSDYLGTVYRKTARKIHKYQGIRFGCIITIAASVIFAVLQFIYPVKTYADEDIKKAIDWCTGSYVSFGNLYEPLYTLTGSLLEIRPDNSDDADYGIMDEIETQSQYITAQINHYLEEDVSIGLYSKYIEEYILPQKNTQVSWSGKAFAGELAMELMGYTTERMHYYEEVLPSLQSWAGSKQAQILYPDYPQRFLDVLEADANVASELYQQVCAAHLGSTDDQWERNIRNLVAEISPQESHRNLGYVEDRKQYLENLQQILRDMQVQLAQQQSGVELAAENEESERLSSIGGGWITMLLSQQKNRELYLYNDSDIQEAIYYGTVSGNAYLACYSAMNQFIQSVITGGESAYHAQYDTVYQTLTHYGQMDYDTYVYFTNLQDQILPNNQRKVSWSYLPFEWELLDRLMKKPVDRAQYYLNILAGMKYWSEDLAKLSLLNDVLQADLATVQELYWICCAVHMDYTNPQWEEVKDLQKNGPIYDYAGSRTIRDLNTNKLQELDADLEEKETALSSQTLEYELAGIGSQIKEQIENSGINLD